MLVNKVQTAPEKKALACKAKIDKICSSKKPEILRIINNK